MSHGGGIVGPPRAPDFRGGGRAKAAPSDPVALHDRDLRVHQISLQACNGKAD